MKKKNKKAVIRGGARPMWKGFLKFGLVTIPVKVFPVRASGGGDIELHWLHASCHRPIHYQKVCPVHGKVSDDEIVSGYEIAKKNYVVIEPEELQKLSGQKDDTRKEAPPSWRSGTGEAACKSGAWLVWVERLFGFLLLGLALFFIAPLLPERVVPWTVLALAAGAGVYLGWLEPSGAGGRVFPWIKKAVGLACLRLALTAGLAGPPAESIAWKSYDPAILEQARRDGRPVILDFYASWCIPCQEMDRSTYTDPRVIEASRNFIMVKIDMTHHQTAKAKRLMEQFDVSGVPTLFFLDRQGREIKAERGDGYLARLSYLRTRPASTCLAIRP